MSVPNNVRRRAYRAMKWQKRRRKTAWIRQLRVRHPQPLDDFALFAIIPTFCEADIIAASVANALAQGSEAVFVVDNDSPDDTVAVAEGAGATVVEKWSSPHQDGLGQKARLHQHAARITAERGCEHAWWLLLDADEFPKGPNGCTVREFLQGIDRSHRIVGANFFNHFPTEEPAYVPGFHPAEFQPLCSPHPGRYCRAQHYKHMLIRYDRAGPELRLGGGQHRIDPECGQGLLAVEPSESLIVQHFQWRREDDSRRRLEVMGERLNQTHQQGLSIFRRIDAIDAVYRHDWKNVYDDGTRSWGIRLRPFRDFVPAADTTIRRWYSEDELAAAVASPR